MKKKIIENRRAKAVEQLKHAGMSKYEIRRRKKLEALNQMENQPDEWANEQEFNEWEALKRKPAE